ncbi:MAG TPA: hypothetical protein O0X23_03865 [Methanocorpusculum sp.]|nr:hypothetical protein [Methanocorpusculum sp.]
MPSTTRGICSAEDRLPPAGGIMVIHHDGIGEEAMNEYAVDVGLSFAARRV